MEQLQARLRNYTTMRADGELSKEEYLQVSRESNQKLNQLSEELASLKEPIQAASLNLDHIQKALNRLVDISKPNISDALIDEFVETIVPVENYHYRWRLSFSDFSPSCIRIY